MPEMTAAPRRRRLGCTSPGTCWSGWRSAGVRLAYVTLHVGADTFRPVSDEAPERHKLHGEYFQLSAEVASELNAAREEGRRIL